MDLRWLSRWIIRPVKHFRFIGLLFLTIIILTACSGWLFYPQKKWSITSEVGSNDFQVLNIEMPDGIVLSAWRMPRKQEAFNGAVLYFHGNSQNISVHSRQVYWLIYHGYDVVLVDYRGYGYSGGDVGLDENISDIANVLQWFLSRYGDKTPKYMIAHSLGATMSGYVIATHKELGRQFNAIVLDAGFADYQQIMRDVMDKHWLLSMFKYPASLGMPTDYDLIDVVGQISPTPVAIIHGKSDPVVPYHHGVDLFEKALPPKVFLSYEGYHNTAFDDQLRRQWLLDYFRQYAR